MNELNTKLYFITDSTNYNEEEFLFRVEEALKGGVTLLQLREKEKTTKEYIELAEKVHNITKKYNVPLIIDDRVDVALAVDAEGVHVGQSDMPVCIARKLMGKDKIVGATTKTVLQAQEAFKQGADYLGVGAVFQTGSKADAEDVSYETLKAICEAVNIPVVAIGGISAGNVLTLKGSGISGIAVISAIFAAEDIEAATKNLKQMIAEVVSK